MLSFSYYDQYNRFFHQNPWQYPNHPAMEIRHDANVAETDDDVVATLAFVVDSDGDDDVAEVVDKDAVICATSMTTVGVVEGLM